MTATTMSVLGRLTRLPLLLLTAHLAPFQLAAAQDRPTGNVVASDTFVGRALEAPVNTRPIVQKFWWSDAWYDDGQLPRAENYRVVSSEITYNNPRDDTEIPATLFRPEGDGKFPAVLFQHGRRGLDDLVRRLPLRLAARGFVVLAPDVYAARFIDPFPIEHREETEHDVSAGIDALLALPGVSTTKICLSSHTRGGYYTLKVATSLKRQDSQVACYVSTYPHWQNPNAGEPMQVYRYAPEIDKLVVPSLIFIGEYEQYQRRRSIEGAVLALKQLGRDVRLITYPGVGRGFDFRPARVRTFADDLATKDAVMRTARFIRRHLKKWPK